MPPQPENRSSTRGLTPARSRWIFCWISFVSALTAGLFLLQSDCGECRQRSVQLPATGDCSLRPIEIPPSPRALLQSLRGMGYSPETALADLVDNSLAAGARQIDLRLEWRDGDPLV